jgi:hypothetical protein
VDLDRERSLSSGQSGNSGSKSVKRRPEALDDDRLHLYSRKDGDFVRRLNEALEARDREAWVDWGDLADRGVDAGIVAAIDAAARSSS